MVVEVLVDGGLDGAWGDVVYGDAVRGKLDGDGPHHHPDAPFGCAVGGVGWHGQVLVHRRDVDDAPPVALRDHLTGGLLAADPHPREVDRDHLLPHLDGRLEEGAFCSIPALLTMTSRRPNSWTVCRIKSFTPSGPETSAWTEMALPPPFSISSTASFACSGWLL